MEDFILTSAKNFAKIIHAAPSKYEELHELKQRFDKEISVFSGLTKNIYLQALTSELQSLFESHLSRCKQENCPQRTTFSNAKFLILEEQKEEKLSSFLNDNSYYKRHITFYYDKLKTTSAFIDKKQFIKEEIDRVRNEFIKPSTMTIISGGTLISEFNYSKFTQQAYEWLKSGQDWPLEQILKSARQQYLQTHSAILNEQEFKNSILENLKGGVAWILYEKFLTEELQNLTVENKTSILATNVHIGDNYGQVIQSGLTETKIKTIKKNEKKVKQSLFMRVFSNPWIITIIGGLILAFLAKTFGWI